MAGRHSTRAASNGGGGDSSRSHARRRRFGFFSIFGFNADVSDAETKDASVDADAPGQNANPDLSSSSGGSSKDNNSRRSATSVALGDAGGGSQNSSRRTSTSMSTSTSTSSGSRTGDAQGEDTRHQPAGGGGVSGSGHIAKSSEADGALPPGTRSMDDIDVTQQLAAAQATSLTDPDKTTDPRQVTPQPINIAARSDRLRHTIDDLGGSSADISGSNTSTAFRSIHQSPQQYPQHQSQSQSQNLSMNMNLNQQLSPSLPHGHQRQSSQIRTCPIPERLRLQLRDSSVHPDSLESSSPTIAPNSARASVDSPRTLTESRVRRRGTIATAGGSVGIGSLASRESRRNLYGPVFADKDKATPIGMVSAGEGSPRFEKASLVAPVARRTSSTHSSWSVATPTSTFGATAAADDASSPVMASSQIDYGISLPDWDSQPNNLQPPSLQNSVSRARSGRSRRYSVFDLSFASQRPTNQQPANCPGIAPVNTKSSTNIPGANVTRRRLSLKNNSENMSSLEAIAQRSRKSGSASVDPNNMFGSRSKSRQPSRLHVAIPTSSGNGLDSSGPISSYSMFSSGLSPNALTMYSGSNNVTAAEDDGEGEEEDDSLLASGSQTPASERGSYSGHSNRRHRRLFSADYHNESSSGCSTPNHLIFARLRRNPSRSIQVAGGQQDTRQTGVSASMSASQQLGRSWYSPTRDQFHHQSQYSQDTNVPADTHGNEIESDGDDDMTDLTYLRMSTSTPDVLLKPMFSSFNGQLHAIKRSDYSYERILTFTRNTKIRRWGIRQNNRKDSSAHNPLQGFGSSPPSSQIFGLARRSTASTVASSHTPSFSRRGSAQRPENERIPRNSLSIIGAKSQDNAQLGAEVDLSSTVAWNDWIDDIPNRYQGSAIVNHVTAMWQRILHTWNYNHHARFEYFKHRRGSSTSYMSGTNGSAPKTPAMISSHASRGNTDSVNYDSFSPLSTSNAVATTINPLFIEPTYLQRGASDSGRHVSPSSAFNAVYQIPAGINTIEHRKSSSGASGESGGFKPSHQLDSTRKLSIDAGRSDLQPVLEANKSVQQHLHNVSLPHRRVSMVKDQELGKSRNLSASSGSSSSSGGASGPSAGTVVPANRSALASQAAGGSSSGSSRDSSAMPAEKSHWMIAQLDDPEEAIELLMAFQQRVRTRLKKAKGESEGELVSIVQDLSEFVEEGLSYVNEDSSGSDADMDADVHSVAADGNDTDLGMLSNGSYLSDMSMSSDDDNDDGDVSVYTPGLQITTRPIPHLLHASSSAEGRRRSKQEEPNASWELKSLNRRLQDVLSQHSNISSTDLHPSKEHGATENTTRKALSSTEADAAINNGNGSSEHDSRYLAIPPSLSLPMPLPPPRRIARSPSIRRIAFLRALAGGDNGSRSTSNAEKSSSEDIPDQNSSQPKSNTFVPPERTDHFPFDIEATRDRSDSLPSQDQLQHMATTGMSEKSRTPSRSSLPCEIPFPDLHKRESTHSLKSINRCISPEALGTYGGRKRGGSSSSCRSMVTRSSSRASVYSAESSRSLVTTPLIAEDEFKPTPFLAAIMDLVNIIGHVLSISADDMLCPITGQLLDEALEHHAQVHGSIQEEARHHICRMLPSEYLAQRLESLGNLWEQPPLPPSPPTQLSAKTKSTLQQPSTTVSSDQSAPGNPSSGQTQQPWPCRGLFFRTLLAISSLNRIVMWYAAVLSTYNDDVVEELGRRSGLHLVPDMDPHNHQGSSDKDRDTVLKSEDLAGSSSRRVSKAGNEYSPVDETASMSSASIIPTDIETDSQVMSLDQDHGEKDTTNTQARAQPTTAHGSRRSSWHQRTASSQNATAMDKGLNMLLEVGLDGRIRYISPTCQQLLGTNPDRLIDQQASLIFDPDDLQVCRSAAEQLLADSTRTVEINVRVHAPDQTHVTSVEAKGMLIYSKTRSEPSHVLWVLRNVLAMRSSYPDPALLSQTDMQQQLPEDMYNDSLGPDGLQPSPLTEFITCRICDRKIPALYFEEHTWTCAQTHRAAMDVEQQNDRLNDIKGELQAWYPGCSIEELDGLTHGELDATSIRARAQQKASEIGDPAWQTLVDEASPVVQSMLAMCMLAMSLDESDAVPKCEMPSISESKIGQSPGFDFARSENWKAAASYTAPLLEYKDPALEALEKALISTIASKMTAVDKLQCAIVESSEACCKWMVSDEEDQDDEAMSEATDPIGVQQRGSVSPTTTRRDSTAPVQDSLSDPKQREMPPNVPNYVWPEKQKDKSLLADTTASSQTQSVDSISRSDALALPQAGKSVSLSSSGVLSTDKVVFAPNTPAISPPALTGQGNQLRINTTKIHPTHSRVSGRGSVSSGSATHMITPTMPSINDFTFLKPISKGAYGSVYLAKKRTTGEYYAIKVLKKADMIAKNQISNVKAERAIMMAQTGSPFVVRLLYTFQTRSSLYLVMDYLNGGDCASLLKSIGTLPINWARQYLAEVVLGIEDLHQRNVVHRDLKPDNLLIDCEGHLKLTDFGLSKLGFLGRRVDQQTLHQQGNDVPPMTPSNSAAITVPSNRVWQALVDKQHSGVPHDLSHGPPSSKRIAELKATPPLGGMNTLGGSGGSTSSSNSSDSNVHNSDASLALPQKHALGTPDYIAPESILGLESGKSVDWWALGVICYEFIFGIPPFHDETPEKVFQNILSAEVEFYDDLREQLAQNGEDAAGEIPEITPEARDFITQLLCRDPRRRLGYGGSAEVKAHPFFRDINWNTLLETQPAFVPQTEDIEDTDYFDSRGATLENSSVDADMVCSGSISTPKIPTIQSEKNISSLVIPASHGAHLHRPVTVPIRLSECDETNDENGSENPEPAEVTEPFSGEDPEFGAFTFKNLHALEQANKDELSRLRRRSTMLDSTTSRSSQPIGSRSSFSHGTSFSSGVSALPPTQRHRSCLEPSLFSHNDLPQATPYYSCNLENQPLAAHSSSSAFSSHRGSLLNPNLHNSSSSLSVPSGSNYESLSPTRPVVMPPGASVPSSPDQSQMPVVALPPPLHHAQTTGGAMVAEEPISEPMPEYIHSNVCLVADDNPVSCKIMEIVLRRLGLDCVIVRNGAEAIRCAMGRTVFRAIFMDTGMPIVDGDEATRMIKSTYNANKDTPIIGVATYEGEAADALYDESIVKPVTFDLVRGCLGLK
ncbi:rim15, signal transduction response regulator [Coemansia sp. Benny D115]|nr:rim15, signal transduction response regulator [Coemansia sp. Benny D115]